MAPGKKVSHTELVGYSAISHDIYPDRVNRPFPLAPGENTKKETKFARDVTAAQRADEMEHTRSDCPPR